MSQILIARPGFLIVAAALGYVAATYLMKLVAQSGNCGYVGMIAPALLLSVVAEILLLRRVELGLAYIAIIAVETLLVLAIASAIGEGLSPREWLGGSLVIAGTLLVSAA